MSDVLDRKDLRAVWRELDSRLEEFAVKAQPLFEKNGWEWYYGPSGQPQPHVPGVQEIREVGYSLAWRALECAEKYEKVGEPHGAASSGRLLVRFQRYDGSWSASISVEAGGVNV